MDKLNRVEDVIGKIEETIETHMSIIHMGSRGLVAKEIKEVDLGFVDLVPLEKRRDTANKTAEIDSAYCPDLNSRVIEIAGAPMIVMSKFNPAMGLDNLYDQKKVTVEMAQQIGVLFAKAHRRARSNDQISEIGHKAIKDNWEELFVVSKDVAQAIDKTISTEDYRDAVEKIRNFIIDNKLYFMSRKNNGFIRQCHGDGHAGNMFVEDNQVKIFDGIGFKNEFSFSDTIADVAFAIMDAIARNRKDIAKEIEASYREKSQDPEGMDRLLDFYICYRAFVRGQISTMIANEMEGKEQARMLEVARKYYDLAVKYLPD